MNIDQLEQQAIDAAIAHQWELATKLNLQIIELDKENLDAYLRLGFSYLQQEKIKEARKNYQLALKIQPKSPVALENLARITVLEEKGSTENPIKIKATLNPDLFLEVPGKTKTVALVNLGQKNHLAELDIGEEVELKLRKRKIEVRTMTGDFIGYIPDDLSKRLIYFLEAHSIYKAYVKEATLSKVVIFIREEKKGAKVAHHSSFPANLTLPLDPQKDTDEDGDDDDEDGDEEEGVENELNEITPVNEDYEGIQEEEDEEEE